MTGPERGSQFKEALPRGMMVLLRMGEEGAVNRLILRGPEDKPVEVVALVAVYPEPRALALVRPENYYGNDMLIYELILGLNLPEGIIFTGVDNSFFRQTLEAGLRDMISVPIPSILLMMGVARGKKQELAIKLFSLPGISPRTALRELQEVVGEAVQEIAKRN